MRGSRASSPHRVGCRDHHHVKRRDQHVRHDVPPGHGSKVWKGSLEEVPFSHSRVCSVPPLLRASGKMKMVVHTIHQGEGGEQGDALMPLLFYVGQHAALEAIQRGMSPDEKLLAFLDDLYIASKPEWGHCTVLHNESCGPIAGSGSMGARRTCGTELVRNQRHATGCREWQKFMTPQLGCGADQRCLLPYRVSRFWAHLWATTSTCVCCWRRFRPNNSSC